MYDMNEPHQLSNRYNSELLDSRKYAKVADGNDMIVSRGPKLLQETCSSTRISIWRGRATNESCLLMYLVRI